MVYASIKGGTNSRVRPPWSGKRPDWKCDKCGTDNRGYWVTCSNCNARR